MDSFVQYLIEEERKEWEEKEKKREEREERTREERDKRIARRLRERGDDLAEIAAMLERSPKQVEQMLEA